MNSETTAAVWQAKTVIQQIRQNHRQYATAILMRAIHSGEMADPDRIMAAVQAAWETHIAAMQAAGFHVK